jgi:predicted adenine nucleotide alpha hydrolase (AANH) superfamily ATPase
MNDLNNRINDVYNVIRNFGFNIIDKDYEGDINQLLDSMNESRIIGNWGNTGTNCIQTFTIPVGRVSRRSAERQIADMIAEYTQSIQINNDTGEIYLGRNVSYDFFIPSDSEDDSPFDLQTVNGFLLQKIK